MQATPGYPGQAPNAAPRVGEWLSEAFTLFGREWLNWCLIGLLYLVILSIPAVGGYIAIIAVVFTSVGIGAAAGGEQGAASGAMGAILGVTVGILLLVIVLLALHAYLHAGMVKAAIKQFRGESISVGDLFSGGDVIAPAMVTEVLQGLGTGLASLLCVLPGYLLASLWIFARPLVIERRMTPGDALRTSMEVTKPHMWMYLVWLILYALIAGSGSAIGIGMVATLPIGHLMLMIAYRDVFGIPGAIPTVSQGIPGEPVGYGAYPPPGSGYAPPPGGQPPAP